MTALNTRIDGHLDGLEVGCELQVADLLRVQLGDAGEQLVQPRVQRLLEHQHLAVTRVLHQPLHELCHLQPNIFRYTGNIFWPEILSCETKYFLALQIIIIPYLALQRGDELAVLREDGQVEVVVVVSDGDLPGRVDADTDGVVGDA